MISASFAPTCPTAGSVHGRFVGLVGIDALDVTVTEPAWRLKPSWYLVAADDHVIPTASAARHGRARRIEDDRGARQPLRTEHPCPDRNLSDLPGDRARSSTAG